MRQEDFDALVEKNNLTLKEMKKQTAMRQLLNQLREERNRITIDAEWNRCFQAIESVIESKYIPIEREQIIDAYKIGYDEGLQIITKYENVEEYYTVTYEK